MRTTCQNDRCWHIFSTFRYAAIRQDRVGCLATDYQPPNESRCCRRVAGPGVGKGRQIAALIFENICRRRTKARLTATAFGRRPSVTVARLESCCISLPSFLAIAALLEAPGALSPAGGSLALGI